MKVDGGCFCQSVRYEAVVDPESVAICHCTDCQTHSGTAYGVVVGILEEGVCACDTQRSAYPTAVRWAVVCSRNL